MPSAEKILFVGHDATRSGAPIILLTFLQWLRQNTTQDFEILLREGGELLDEFRKTGPTKVLKRGLIVDGQPSLAAKMRRKLGRAEPLSAQLRRLYPKRQFPVVYSNTVTNGDLVCALADLGHRIICHAHEMRMVIEAYEALYGDGIRRGAGRVDLFISASAAARQDLIDVLNVPAAKIEMVHEFGQPMTMSQLEKTSARMTIRQQLGLDDSAVVIGMCGTLEWRKGADLFLLLANAVTQLAPAQKFHFVWIGANLTSANFRQFDHDRRLAGLEKILTVVPTVPNPLDYLSAIDIFALTSREDPFPLVMLEAAALGVPILCFRSSGGGAELVGDDAGITVPYLDLTSMAKAVIGLGNNPATRKSMGEKARAKSASMFSLEVQAPKLQALIGAQMKIASSP